jgi:hypothetical protein
MARVPPSSAGGKIEMRPARWGRKDIRGLYTLVRAAPV